MQIPEKKRSRRPEHLKGMILIVLILALLVIGGGLYWVTRPQETAVVETADKSTPLVAKEEAQLSSITVSAPEGENYTLLYQEGALWYQGETPFRVDDILTGDILTACTSLSAEETLAEETPEDLAAFGLNPPQCTVTIAYTDGEAITYHIGDPLTLETGYYFMIAGDKRLYRVHDDILDTFQVEAGVLYPVEQVRLTGSLIDRVALYDSSDALLYEFQRRGGSFYMTYPQSYPTDGEMFTNILSALENFRLGAYVNADTSANRESLGDYQYRLVIHEGAGSASVVDGGVLTSADQAEKTTSLLLWPMGDGQTGYCAVGGGIYRFLRLSLAFLYETDLGWDTLPLKPAGDVTVENLASLTVNGDIYQLTRTERVKENNELETDAEGHILYDTTVTKNGQAMSLDAFESRLTALASVSVGGRLPAGYQPSEAVTDTLAFTFTDGATRVITLTPYDALHNAVGVDGVYLFYLIKGGLSF
ncbi:MAG: DUF4340 domain-containing protein [Clostridia bacterium]|nr:DUF4340 domain-containing protein [Clostridia bacterium]